MVQDEQTPSPQAPPGTPAKDCVALGPVPDWVVPCSYKTEVAAKPPIHVTYLLISRQVHAENRQIHTHVAVRLETMQAVQRESQWRLEFEPRTQSIILHTLSVRRGDTRFERANLDNVRFLQRESGLEGYVIDGLFTMLAVLEDVRPGDILEWSYTLKSEPRILPEKCASVFTLPQGMPVGKFHFSVIFNSDRPLKWKASDPGLQPTESLVEGQTIWVWWKENPPHQEPEPNTPSWFIDYLWIQISDCPDWGSVAAAVAKAWKEEPEDPAVAQIAKEIAEKQSEPLLRIESAIRFVQDEFRYLSVNLELGGQTPAAPGTVARRRFGDCKDLSFLMIHLLKRLEIPARPVLVNTVLRKSVSAFLPTAGLFNHVVVEYQAQGETHWVDATLKKQGGNPLTMIIGDFGAGLPVESGCSNLVATPHSPELSSNYDLKESILLDTTGDSSYLGVVLTARGGHAETMRQQFEAEGLETFAEKRLRACADRFGQAKRAGPLSHRDDREANEFCVAEVFEINGFMKADVEARLCFFQIPNDLIMSVLRIQADKARRTPWALPHPCNIVHTIEIQSPAVHPQSVPTSRIGNAFVQFSRTHKALNGYWSAKFTLSTLADAVPPEAFQEHLKKVEQIWAESRWQWTLPLGHARPRRRNDFAALPPVSRKQGSAEALSSPKQAQQLHVERVAPMLKQGSSVPAQREMTSLVAEAGAGLNDIQNTSHKRRRSGQPVGAPAWRGLRHHARATSKKTEWMWIAVTGVVIALIVLLGVMLSRSGRP